LLSKETKKKAPRDHTGDLRVRDRQALVRSLYILSGQQALNRILEQDNPREVVQELPNEDFFWLIKKVGEDDSLPLLELASLDQWEYVLDLEVWKKDRLHLEQTSLWFKRLQQADPDRLIRWLFSDGQELAYYHLFRSLEVVIREGDEVMDLPGEFFTVDGVFYIRVTEPRYRDSMEDMIKMMAREDSIRYQALLLGLAGVLPAETEEELYRLRNVRLAERGFLPFEEAISVYSPLEPEALRKEGARALKDVAQDEEGRDMAPVLPFYQADARNLLMEVASRITDPIFLDRIRMEFAGLCNQVLSADGMPIQELEVLVRTCRKAASYLSLGLEGLFGKDIESAEACVRKNSLLSIFRVGFGLALKLKWQAEGWVKRSWFFSQGLPFGFWGEAWGGCLAGLLQKRPRFYTGLGEEAGYKDFERLTELEECRKILHGLMALDGLLDRIEAQHPMDEEMLQDEDVTFYPLLFNLWARDIVGLKPDFSGITLLQAKSLFARARAGGQGPPFPMPGMKDAFVNKFMAFVANLQPEVAAVLRDTLSLIWQEFRQEYERIPVDALDGRYSRFLSILS
jgi:hypothetical protein